MPSSGSGSTTPPAPDAAEHDRTMAPSAVPAGRAVSPRAPSLVGPEGAPPPAGHGEPGTGDLPPGAASLLLRLPEQEGPAEGPIEVAVDPGARVTLLGLIRNQSPIVDNYDLSVSGLPEDWWTIMPATAYLVPYGSGGTYEQEVQIHLHPPRTPQAQARPWPFEVVAESRAYGAQAAAAPATMQVGAYRDIATELKPERASGRLKARFALTVRNRANAPAHVLLAAEDTDAECRFRFAEPAITIEPGEGVEAPFTVFPPKQIWVGRPRERRIQATAAPAQEASGGPPEVPVLPRMAVFRQRSWLPWWLSLLAPAIAGLIVLALLLAPKQTTVPNLTKTASVFAAEKLLIKNGLKLSPTVGQVTKPGVAPGAIADQAPAAGKKVKRGTTVTVQVAVGSSQATVPSVVGATPGAADAALRTAGLALGAVSPQPPDPTATIASQIPSAGQSVKTGTPVAVFQLPPVKAVAGKGTSGATGSKAAAAAAAGAAAAGGAGAAAAAAAAASGPPVTIPTVSGNPMAAAAQLSQLGLVPASATQLAAAPAGALVGSQPPAGTQVPRGSKVTLIVSGGAPDLSYDDGQSIHIINGLTGKPAATVPPSPQGQEEAAWSHDGTRLIYRQGTQLFLLAPGTRGAQPLALTDTTTDDHDPALAPAAGPAGLILAFIQAGKGGNQLCFAVVGPNVLAPDCTGHPGWTLAGPVSWSTDGSHVLVFGVQQGAKQSTFGLIEFVSNVPFSTQASQWGHGTIVTDTTHPGEGAIAGVFAPVGKQVAVIANLAPGGFHLYLAQPNDLALAHTPPLPVGACEVAWRSDAKELAVVGGDTACGQRTSTPGNLETLNPANPSLLRAVAPGVAHPAWQPLTPHG